MLELAGVADLATQAVPVSVIGGIDKKSTDEHLAWRFSGSCARVQLAMLDPHAHLSNVSDAFARVFSGGDVLMADVPCGSGAAALSVLSTIAELRKCGRVPRYPLRVKLVGGELSESARQYAREGLNNIMTELNEQAIWVTHEFHSWDALCKFSTADLIKRLTLLGDGCAARALVLANFSGFLSNTGKWKDAAPQFESLFVHSRDEQSVAIWIEPQTNSVLNKDGGFFGRLLSWFKLKFGAKMNAEEINEFTIENLGITAAETQHPLREEQQFQVNLVVQRFDLRNNGASE
ncbi:hypothetical protein ACFQ09_19060 [Massilia norwichensis]|uniref:SAM-dependent methyltransferase n=1 Tax=Massilia norwichensis TaxID=1442366 RepID=A0ABT2A8D3_9BURK|nr:hypothetical protein [Massilia norwichensis]MCS0590422.1 hypothetical protein [Massilia norwichensis]